MYPTKSNQHTNEGDDLTLISSKEAITYSHYAVGNGCLVKWKLPDDAPDLIENEVFCHWMSNYDRTSVEEQFKKEIEPFHGTEIMLIGALVVGTENLVVNSNCVASISNRRTWLLDQGKLNVSQSSVA